MLYFVFEITNFVFILIKNSALLSTLVTMFWPLKRPFGDSCEEVH
jgi:hypothetical protein